MKEIKDVCISERPLRELHLFSGVGGGILGGMLLGHTCVCAVELEPYCRKVLLQRQRDGILPRFPIWDDITTFDGKPWCGLVDIVAGGFPCQDISCAGKGAGITGSRSSLWKEMARVIGEIQPRYAWMENSPMLVGRGLETVLADLAAMGFSARWGVVGACDAGAPHQRYRIWILAHTTRQRGGAGLCQVEQEQDRIQPANGGCDVADAKGRKSWEQTERQGRQDTQRRGYEINKDKDMADALLH